MFLLLPFLLCGCANSDEKLVVKEINEEYAVEILKFAAPIACRYDNWQETVYEGIFELQSDAEIFMDAFSEAQEEKQDDGSVKAEWISSETDAEHAEILREKIILNLSYLSESDLSERAEGKVFWLRDEQLYVFPETNTVYFYKIVW